MKKLLIILWCLYFSATCKQGANKPDLVFIKATSQSWGGGAAGSGHGMNYNFYFIVKNQSVKCDSVWVDGYALAVKQTINPNSDTLHLVAQAYFHGSIGPPADRAIVPKRESPPMVTKDAAVVSYTSGSNKKFVTATTVMRLKSLDYP